MANRKPFVNVGGTLSEIGVSDNLLLSPAIASGQPVTYDQVSGFFVAGLDTIAYALPSTGTTRTTLGTTPVTSGTLSHPALTSTSLLTSTKRTVFTSAVTVGALVWDRQPNLFMWRGNAAGRGGFKYTIDFSAATLVAGNYLFFGLSDIAANPTSVDPTTSSTFSKLGIGANANTGNWKLINNLVGTAPTVTDLGSSFPVNTTDSLELVISCAANDSGFSWTLTNETTGAFASGRATTNIPSSTTFIAPLMYGSNNATASAMAVALAGWRVEPPAVMSSVQTTGYGLLGATSCPKYATHYWVILYCPLLVYTPLL